MALWIMTITSWRGICPGAKHYYVRVQHSKNWRRGMRSQSSISYTGAYCLALAWFQRRTRKGDVLVLAKGKQNFDVARNRGIV